MAATPLELAMKADLAGLFTYDMPRTVIIVSNGITTTYTCLLNDFAEDEIDELGGAMVNMGQTIHFLVSDLPSVEPGSTLFLQDADPNGPPGTFINRKKLVISTTTSADRNELIVLVKGG